MPPPPLPPSTPPSRWRPVGATTPAARTPPPPSPAPPHPFTGPAPMVGQPPPGGRPPRPRRAWLYVLIVVAVLAIVVGTLLLTVGRQHTTLSGDARPAPVTPSGPSDSPRAVADRFIALETARYNAAGTDTPPANRASYGAVSCAADLAQMPDTGASLTPAPGPVHYTFSPPTITPTTGGRYLLQITRTDTTTGDQGDGLFFLQQESGRWVVCGLYPNTEPNPDATGTNNGADPVPSPAPLSAPVGSGSDTGPPTTVSAFLTTLAQAVSSGQIGTAAEMICLDDPAADSLVESWASAHAHIDVQAVDTSGGPTAASARIDVTPPDQAPGTYGLILQQAPTGWCIEALQQQ